MVTPFFELHGECVTQGFESRGFRLEEPLSTCKLRYFGRTCLEMTFFGTALAVRADPYVSIYYLFEESIANCERSCLAVPANHH